MAADISAEFPFESKYAEGHGTKLHYVEEARATPPSPNSNALAAATRNTD